jgi:hypothetical protein
VAFRPVAFKGVELVVVRATRSKCSVRRQPAEGPICSGSALSPAAYSHLYLPA